MQTMNKNIQNSLIHKINKKLCNCALPVDTEVSLWRKQKMKWRRKDADFTVCEGETSSIRLGNM